MATLIDNGEFTANEIYQIQATDPVEGAAAGASFGGTGISNQPHQQLANRTAFLKGRQDTNIASIAALQAFVGNFSGLMGQSGYVFIPFADTMRGQISALVQWGIYKPGGGVSGDHVFVVNWPIPFPNVCEWAAPVMLYKQGTSPDVGVGVQTDGSGNPNLTTASGTFFCNLFNLNGNTPGFGWIAIGF
ncbi:MAG TPA: hypothetical protein VIX12_02660 [Candidatus Binataceae bacterium]